MFDDTAYTAFTFCTVPAMVTFWWHECISFLQTAVCHYKHLTVGLPLMWIAALMKQLHCHHKSHTRDACQEGHRFLCPYHNSVFHKAVQFIRNIVNGIICLIHVKLYIRSVTALLLAKLNKWNKLFTFNRVIIKQVNNYVTAIMHNLALHHVYCHAYGETVDRVSIDDWIYRTLWYCMWLHFTIHYFTHKHTHTHTSVHSPIFTSCCSVAASMVDIPLPLVSQTIPGLSYQLLTATAHNNWTSAVL
jgi:hypothetical protein